MAGRRARPPPTLRAAATLAVALRPLVPLRAAAAAPRVLTLEGIDKVTGLQRADTNQDGIIDLLLLSGRRLHVWGATRAADSEERRVAATPRASWEVPADVSFATGRPLAAQRGTPQGDDVAFLGKAGWRMGSEGAGQASSLLPPEARAAGLSWRDNEQLTFTDCWRDADNFLIPTADGWLHASGYRLRIPRTFRVKAPGPFLEDTCTIEHGLPQAYVGAGGLWAIADRKLINEGPQGRVTYDVAFLGAGEGGTYDQTLVDLDGDRRPEILHRIYTNRQVHYGFFRTQAATGTTGPSHKPANCRLSLQGFQLDPQFVDLNADGRLDLVITSMQVNAANMVAALSKGKIVAETRAFLNKSAGSGTYFRDTPDALVKSEIGVKVRFDQAGNIEVVRTLMIVTDGDFDGDGRKDLAIRTGPDTIRIHAGRAAGVWAPEAEARAVAIPPIGRSPDIEGYAMDLDGDRKDEFVLVYRAPSGGKDVVRIIAP
ncbi:MAG: VCBS repeat-containing protein [Planctomycetota bacterium]|nr:VCBS repeat-containing protein [Planctomycetota bacterium]